MLCMSAALGLSACHHHHHHNSSGAAEPETPAEPENPDNALTLQGKVIDGYLEAVTVCADLNGNNACDEDEPKAATNESGAYQFAIDKSKVKDHFRVLAKADKSAKNHIFGSASDKLSTSLVLGSTVFLNKNGELTQDTANITPYSTLATLTMAETDSGISEEDYQNRIKEIAESVGVSPVAVQSDYNSDSTSKDSVTALVGGETLVRANLLPKDESEFGNISDNGLLTPDSVKESTEQYRDAIADVSSSIDKSISSGEKVSGDDIAQKIGDTQARLGSSFRVLASGSADDWSCGVTRDNNVYCWGNNSWGNLGDPELYEKTMADAGKTVLDEGNAVIDNFSAEPVAVKVLAGKDENGKNIYAPLSNVRTVTLGNIHACAVTFAGEVYCWGGNWRGQLGVAEELIYEGENANYKFLYAQKVLKGQQQSESDYLTNIESLALAQNASCALTRDGEVYCWGDNTSSRLGSPYYEGASYNYYYRVLSRDSGIELSSGKGGLACNPASADCEPEFIQIVPQPVKLKFPDSVAKVKKLIPGIWAYCALTENKSAEDRHNLYCWGNDSTGTISHNYSKHFAELKEKYIGKKINGTVYKYSEPWFWWIYEVSGEYYSLFGEPITLIDKYDQSDVIDYKTFDSEEARDEYAVAAADECQKGANDRPQGCFVEPGYDDEEGKYYVSVWAADYSIDITDVTDVALQQHDSNLLLAFKPDVDIDSPDLPGRAGIYGAWNNALWMNMDLSEADSPIGTEWVKRIISNPSNSYYYLLTGKDELFFTGVNRYGAAGRGNPDVFAEVNDFVLASDGESRLSNVVDVNMGKRSICASVRKVADAETGSLDSVKYDMLCWGSSAFGQLGFDNGDGGFSFITAMGFWDDQGGNSYLDKETRYLTLPIEVTSCMFEGENCPAAPEPEPEIKLDLSDLEIQPKDGYVYISVVDPKAETIKLGEEEKFDLYWWSTEDTVSAPYGTNPALNEEGGHEWNALPHDDGIKLTIRKDDDSDATVLTYEFPVAGYGKFCGIPRMNGNLKLFGANDFCVEYSDEIRKQAFVIYKDDKVTETLNELFEEEE